VTPSAHLIDDIRLLIHTLPLSPDLQDHRTHHPMRTVIITEVTATKIRVDRFEMRKHTSSSATKNITIAHISSAQGRLKMMAIGSSPNFE